MYLTSPHSAFGVRAWSRADLRSTGWSSGRITRAVRSGELLRCRNGVYLPAHADGDVVTAARLGGRLACVSELRRLGVFVLEDSGLHMHLEARGSRTRTPGAGVRRHRDRLMRGPHPRSCTVERIDAVRQAVRCQAPRAAVATLDSALHLGVIGPDDVDEVFRRLPKRFRVLRRLVDARAESGPESLMRLILRSLGARFEVQVVIGGVGRVDFVVDGWLIIECDSAEFHGDWQDRRRDLRRDQAAAAQGYVTYRAIAEDLLWHPDRVGAAVRGLLASRTGRATPARRAQVSPR